MIKRLRIKFVCVIMAVAVLMLGIIFGMVLHFSRSSAERESVRMMQSAFGPHPKLPPGEAFPRLPYFTLRLEADGKLLLEGGRFFDLSGETLLRSLYDQAAAEPEPVGVLRAYSLRYCRGETPQGLCIAYADISGELAAQNRLLKDCLLIGMGSLAVFLIVSIALSGWAVRPVAAAWTQQRQFVSDASHELKTPLTVILTNAELLQDAEKPEARAQFTENIVVMAREMRGLIEGMLELARADSGARREADAAVDFSRLVGRALLPFEPIFFEKGLSLSGEIGKGIVMRGSEAELIHLLEILLDNAQKYSAPGGAVWVRLAKNGPGHCLLAVSSPGEPLSPEARRDVFKRFYRADEARSRDGSYGLGLSIAEAVVKRHRGRIWADSGEGRNTFLVQLPTIRKTT